MSDDNNQDFSEERTQFNPARSFRLAEEDARQYGQEPPETPSPGAHSEEAFGQGYAASTYQTFEETSTQTTPSIEQILENEIVDSKSINLLVVEKDSDFLRSKTTVQPSVSPFPLEKTSPRSQTPPLEESQDLWWQDGLAKDARPAAEKRPEKKGFPGRNPAFEATTVSSMAHAASARKPASAPIRVSRAPNSSPEPVSQQERMTKAMPAAKPILEMRPTTQMARVVPLPHPSESPVHLSDNEILAPTSLSVNPPASAYQPPAHNEFRSQPKTTVSAAAQQPKASVATAPAPSGPAPIRHVPAPTKIQLQAPTHPAPEQQSSQLPPIQVPRQGKPNGFGARDKSTSQIIKASAADPRLKEGSRVGNYEIVRKIGQGGMGVVYEGRHLLLPRRVAIKFLLTDQSQDEEQIRRFLGEAVAASQIEHKGVVGIYDYGYDEKNTAYLVMDYIDGRPLVEIMKETRQLPIPKSLKIMRDVAEVLSSAHKMGIIHRDIKPDNLLIIQDESGDDIVKVLDFGVAKFVNAQALSGKTKVGSILGTPWYMPPEQCRGSLSVDSRSDIYALGCVLYHMLCGKVPFAGSLRDVLRAHLSSTPIPPHQLNPLIPAVVEQLIARMMQKDPDHRPTSMDEVASILNDFVNPGSARTSNSGMSAISVQGMHQSSVRHQASMQQSPIHQSSVNMGVVSMSQKHEKKSNRWGLPIVVAIVAIAATSAAFFFLNS